MNATRAMQWAQAMFDYASTVRADGSPRHVPLVPPKLAGCVIEAPDRITLRVVGCDDTITVPNHFWPRFWERVAFCDDLATQDKPHGLTWRHEWGGRTVRDSRGYRHPCDCGFWQRAWRLVRGK